MGIDSRLPPVILFHRYFQECLCPPDRAKYKGKQDLERLPERWLRSLLSNIQSTLNESLDQTRGTIATLGHQRSVHFDYVNATVPNALAFDYKGCSFIGITMPLIELLLRTSERLSRSAEVAGLLRVAVSNEQQELAYTVLFMAQLIFVGAHEFGHHIFGHTSSGRGGTELWSDILTGLLAGSLEHQAQEVQADGYATYLVLHHLVESQQRRTILEMVGHGTTREAEADEILLALFLLAVGAFFFVRPPDKIGSMNIYALTHPPQAARMNSIMHAVQTWCIRRDTPRPTIVNFRACMNVVADAILDITGGRNWDEQTVFLESERGTQYFRELSEACEKLIAD